MVGVMSYFFPQLCKGKPTTLTCIAPKLIPDANVSDNDQELKYTVIMDNASGPDITQSSLRLVLHPNPVFTAISESDRMILIGTSSNIRIIVGHGSKG